MLYLSVKNLLSRLCCIHPGGLNREIIEDVMNWLEPKLARDIQVFIGFPNFYCGFI